MSAMRVLPRTSSMFSSFCNNEPDEKLADPKHTRGSSDRGSISKNLRGGQRLFQKDEAHLVALFRDRIDQLLADSERRGEPHRIGGIEHAAAVPAQHRRFRARREQARNALLRDYLDRIGRQGGGPGARVLERRIGLYHFPERQIIPGGVW